MKSFFFILLLLATSFFGSTQDYKKIHRKAIVADTHNDVLGILIKEGWHLEDDLNGKADSDLARFKEGGVDIQVFAVWCDSTLGKDTAFKYANLEIDSLYAITNRNSDKMMLVRSDEELRSALKQKKLASLIGVEGGHMIEDNWSYLDSLYKRGVRYLTLT
jgi:membrane dipeptidase